MSALPRLASSVWAGAGPGEDAAFREKLVWFRRLVLLHVAARSFLNMPFGSQDPLENALRGMLVVVGLVGTLPRVGLIATRAAAALVFLEIFFAIPFIPNHVYLEWIVLTMLAIARAGEAEGAPRDEGALLLQSLRVTLGLFFFYTGLQKLLWGYWFDGQFLAYVTATEARFATVFQWLMPDAELARLRSYNVGPQGLVAWEPRDGAGPYRVDSWLFVAFSNAIYLAEMAIGATLLNPRLRPIAALAAIGMVIGIEAGARELTFGALMVGGLLLFLPGAWTRPYFYALVPAYLYLAVARFGWLPMFPYTPA